MKRYLIQVSGHIFGYWSETERDIFKQRLLEAGARDIKTWERIAL